MSFFSVTKFAPTLVTPYEPTPSGNLPLSFMDRLPASRFMVDSIHVFQHGQQPAMVIKAALSKALVLYYPVAGRLAVSSNQGELEVACTGDGVWFVEASVDGSLEDFNHLELPLAVPKEELLPYLSPEVEKDNLIVMMQVTQFSCGGFVVGMRSSHAMFDGLGAAQFVQAIADIARGLTEPTIKPIWYREAIPSPPKLPSLRPPPSLTTHPFVTFLLDISLDQIDKTRSKFRKETGKYCSKFDILTAKIWQSRARAISLKPGVDVRVGFAANARHLMHQLLPQEGGYYGNCAYPMTITAPSEKITDSSLFEVINLIREAKESLLTKFSKWLVGDPEGDPFEVPVDYGLLCVSDWSRVGFDEVDYGWGYPIHVGPLDDNSFIPSCIFLKPPAPKQGVRLITRCVVQEQLGAFQDQMVNLV